MQIMSNILEHGKYIVQESRRSSVSSAEDDYQILHKTQLYDFAYPMAGMFLWLRAHFETHPLYGKVENLHLAKALWIFMTTKPYLVLVAPGAMFCPTPQILEEKGWQYFRLCFAAIDDDLVETHSKHTVDAFVDFWAIDEEKKIDDLLREDQAAEARMAEAVLHNQVR
jgi:aspartate/methionine/tyrosine aminotransferase